MNDEIFNVTDDYFDKGDPWSVDSIGKYSDSSSYTDIPEIIYSDQYFKGIDFINFEDIEKIDSSPSINGASDLNGNSMVFEIKKLPAIPMPTVSVIREKGASPSGRRRSNFSPAIKKTLNDWLFDNIKNPYPTSPVLSMLEEKTGLTKKQIRVYLTNNRSRLLLRSPRKGERAQRTLEISEDL